MQAAERAKNAIFVSGELDLWPPNSSERGTKHAFRVSLAQICSTVPEVFHTRTKNHRLTASKTQPSAVHCVKILSYM